MKQSEKSTIRAQTLHAEDRRRNQRVMIRVPLTLRYEADGKQNKIDAITMAVNDHGALVLCTENIPAETIFELQNSHTGETQPCRVTRKPSTSDNGYLIPVEFLTSNTDIWHITFPLKQS